MKDTSDRTEYPILLRFLLRIGRPFGLHFVPQKHLQVINHMGQYSDVRGPGLVHYNRLTESLGPLVNIGGQLKEYNFTGLLTRDVLSVGIRLHAIIGYDPRSAPDFAPILTRLPREIYVSIAGTFLRWALLAAVGQYNATELAQREVRAEVESSVCDTAIEEMGFLGIAPRGKLRIMQVDLPTTLAGRHETIAQRRAGILAGTEYHPAEFRRALVTEVIENLGRSGSGETFVNFNELIEAYAADRKPGKQPRQIVDNPPQSALGKDEDSKPAPASPGSRPGDTAPKPTTRPRSRL